MHYKPQTSMEGTEFDYIKSNCCTPFDKIRGFIYGPF